MRTRNRTRALCVSGAAPNHSQKLELHPGGPHGCATQHDSIKNGSDMSAKELFFGRAFSGDLHFSHPFCIPPMLSCISALDQTVSDQDVLQFDPPVSHQVTSCETIRRPAQSVTSKGEMQQ